MNISDFTVYARKLMDNYELYNWIITIDSAKRRLGCCKYSKKTLSFSKFFIENNSLDEITDTVLHEIAHALSGSKAGHGPIWKKMASRIGANPKSCAHGVVMEKGKHQLACPSCKRIVHYYRKPKTSRACGMCCRAYNNGKFTTEFLLQPLTGN